MKKFNFLFILVLSLSLSCSSDNDPQTEDPQNEREADTFITAVIDIMEANSINRGTIDWEDFRDQVQARVLLVSRDNALQLALRLLGDNHSFISKEDGTYILGNLLNCPSSNIAEVMVPDNIGYVKVGAFSGPDIPTTIAFAENIQEEIRTQDSQEIKGWIVDLRNNTGGNMWPMLSGLGPILGEGTAGFFVEPDDSRTGWSYAQGSAIIGESPLVTVAEPYELINPNPKVAVLLNTAVASSGEAIAISFIGRSNTKSFGSATCGLSTANSGFNLSDGSTLFLTTASMADRNENIYGVSIEPDMPSADEDIIQNAVTYINE
ncbi:S41 family peptidase [uncultured Croceitalea sp.]|uniref:S41 family peptidase n=1 Tax=uncultured Croceitalea sp. TaxID=1798908 RepID=UPI00330637DC